jgi:hypothetical protein
VVRLRDASLAGFALRIGGRDAIVALALAYVAVVDGWLAYAFISISTAQPHYGEEAIGLVILLPIAISSGAGVLVRVTSFVMAARGWSKITVSRTNLLGFAIPLSIFGSTIAWLAWS